MEELCEVLEPFKDVTKYLSVDKFPILTALGPLFAKLKKKLETDPTNCPSAVIHTVKQVVFSDMEIQYSDPDVCLLMNKAALLDPCFKSLTHLPEEDQEATVNSIVNEIVTGYVMQSTINCTSAASETVIIDEEPGEHTDPSPKKKCCLEKILGNTFSVVNTDSSLSVSFNELVLAEVSRYKSEPESLFVDCIEFFFFVLKNHSINRVGFSFWCPVNQLFKYNQVHSSK